MNGQVVMCSAFRDSAGGQMERYFRQVDAYRAALDSFGWRFRLVAVEGDSTDSTRADYARMATERGITFDLRTCDVGGKRYGSVEHLDRFEKLSRVGNCALDGVHTGDDVVVYVESDLIWTPETLIGLGSHVVDRSSPCDVVAPLIMAGPAFYDIWAFRGLDGERFRSLGFPYHKDVAPSGLSEVGSVGSCLVMRAEVARIARIVDNECLVGFCRDARNCGFRIWVDVDRRVNHP